MKIVIFGGAGFLGSHVADVLTGAGHEVTIFDRHVSSYLKGSQKMIVGDVLDEDKVYRAISGCDIVYNFAGISDIEEASQNPLDAIKFNVLGNSIILDACRKYKIKRFIFASSLYVYNRFGSFYRSTKQSCELFIENYNEIFGLPYTILRYGSVYGPRSDKNNFIYCALKQVLEEKKITREGDGEEMREYIHVYDAAKMSVEILSDEFVNEYVIITGNQQMKVKDLLLLINEMFNNEVKIEYKPIIYDYHYEITPYNFAPKLAKRIISRTYLDLGQGLLDMVHQMFDKTCDTKEVVVRE